MPAQLEHRPSSQIQKSVWNGAVVYEKRYVTNDWDDEFELIQRRAKQEIEILRALATSNLFERRLGVVQVAQADANEATIATFEISGAPLEEFILESKDSRTNLLPWFLAGRWLRKFQSIALVQATGDQVSKRDPTDIVEYCNLRLNSLGDFNYRWPNVSGKESILGSLRRLRAEMTESDNEQVWVHADYAPGNLMWDGRTLTPIDFAMIRPGIRLEDATYLIHRVEMQLVYRPWLKLPVSAIRKAILKGIGNPAAEKSAVYQLLMIKHLVCRLHTYVRRPPTNLKQAIHGRWVRSIIRRRLQKAVAKINANNN